MAENTTNIVSQVIAALKTNGADISQLTPTDNPADTDLIELSGGKYVKFGVIRKIVEDAFADLERIDTILSGRINQLATDHATDKASMQSMIASLRADLDALDHDNATGAIESFREILAFLDGCKDDETLLAKLTEIKGLITEEASTRLDQIVALDEELDSEMQNCRDADEALGARIDDEAHIRLSEDEALAGKITRLDKRDKHKVINLEQDDDIEGPELVVPAPTKYATLEAALEKVKTNHEVLFGSILTYYDGLKYVRIGHKTKRYIECSRVKG